MIDGSNVVADLLLFASGPTPTSEVASGAVLAIVAAVMAPTSQGWVPLD